MNILRFIPALLWMTVIYLYSDVPAVRSTEQSITVTERLLNLISRFITVDIETRAYLIATMEPYIRKLAHMTEYAVLFFLIVLPVGIFVKRRSGIIFVSWIICLIYAASDEFHQTFVPGRSGMISDVLIDMLGVLAATLVYLIFAGIKALCRALLRDKNTHKPENR